MIGVARAGVGSLIGLMLLAACNRPESVPDASPRVAAIAYDAFFVWPGVRPADNLHPKILYLLDGEVRRSGVSRLERLRMGVPHLPGKTIWLVVRTDRLDWGNGVHNAIVADLDRWRAAGNSVAGLQVDFDAATHGIGGYARFLTEVRRRLPPHWRLSITGLLDWSAHGDPRELGKLAHTVDEVVVQTYQGRSTIAGYEAYFRRMEQFPIPFRVALVEGGKWRAPPSLARNPHFRGYVVFLLNSFPDD